MAAPGVNCPKCLSSKLNVQEKDGFKHFTCHNLDCFHSWIIGPDGKQPPLEGICQNPADVQAGIAMRAELELKKSIPISKIERKELEMAKEFTCPTCPENSNWKHRPHKSHMADRKTVRRGNGRKAVAATMTINRAVSSDASNGEEHISDAIFKITQARQFRLEELAKEDALIVRYDAAIKALQGGNL